MSNLGYFQLKANPGIWLLRLAEGMSKTLYQITFSTTSSSIKLPKEPSDEKLTSEIVLNRFEPQKLTLLVKKREGMEQKSLFDSESKKIEKPEGGLWDKLSGLFGKEDTVHDSESIETPEEEEVIQKENDTIHIFSLASGHLYERFLKAMMLSVVRNTQSPVKFWLLSNFLSPQFKEFVPKMASHYGFDVELVTYQWPDWLHPQTEKQRIIWGYKILFLDVLFPIDLKKIIYIDADQTVRADIKELWDIDLEGAPYGYTPFCSGALENPETKGFKFWASGFWKDHLMGKPYHISALYVVDLHTLREEGFADRLRATYNGLSSDPNSLANLDQDLPNYLQHIVPIHSLPENWLWCETWCTMESQKDAKTIDLCNNPLTKLPKLEAAVKFVPEWTNYDKDIKSFENSLREEESHDVNDLKEDTEVVTQENTKEDL
jgi:UDP-glucose:glycoprotein glucosyltransferase